MNDLLYILLDSPTANIDMYAEDTVIYASDICPDSAREASENVLQRLYRWCQINKLTINFKKTKHMMIFRNNIAMNNMENSTVRIENNILDNVTSYHYLGIDLDSNLTFDKMLDCICIIRLIGNFIC